MGALPRTRCSRNRERCSLYPSFTFAFAFYLLVPAIAFFQIDSLFGVKGKVALVTGGSTGRKTGDARARMRYSDDGYALGIVKRRRLKLLGWPWHLNIPFGNLSHIGGGQTSLAYLLALLNAGLLRFEPATDEEVELAGRNWTAVLPGVFYSRKFCSSLVQLA
ncbi:hypothetical protein C8Q74DRAFT_1311973 [Fomes fomentarius]|nr:hypothetical protein C8Q74DRAFT_1311973 [Fomes fomentarius]